MLRIARAITLLGEQTGSEFLIYNPLVQYGFERAARRNAPVFARSLLAEFPDLRRVVDVGCGTGAYVATLLSLGINAIGVEYSARLRRKCRDRGVRVFPFDLRQGTPPPPDAPFDLAYSLEVAEHVPPEHAGAMVDYVAGLSDVVVFTAAQPGQGGPHHINEQPREFWIKQFEKRGMKLHDAVTERLARRLQEGRAFYYLPRNVSVFLRDAR